MLSKVLGFFKRKSVVARQPERVMQDLIAELHENVTKELLLEIITQYGYEFLIKEIEKKNFDLVDRILSIMKKEYPDKILEMLTDNEYRIFEAAARVANFNLFNNLVQLMEEKGLNTTSEMINFDDSHILKIALYNGDLVFFMKLIELIEEKASDQLSTILNCNFFKEVYCVHGGDFLLFNKLIGLMEKKAPNTILEMLIGKDADIFKKMMFARSLESLNAIELIINRKYIPIEELKKKLKEGICSPCLLSDKKRIKVTALILSLYPEGQFECNDFGGLKEDEYIEAVRLAEEVKEFKKQEGGGDFLIADFIKLHGSNFREMLQGVTVNTSLPLEVVSIVLSYEDRFFKNVEISSLYKCANYVLQKAGDSFSDKILSSKLNSVKETNTR